MNLIQLNHLKKELQGVEAISDYTSYRRRRAKQQNNINYKSEEDRLIGELSQTTITPGTSDRIERRKRDIKDAYQGNQYTKKSLFPKYIHTMPDIYGINYNGVKPRPTYEELINVEDYPVKYPDRSATFTRDSPLLTQFDGIGMMELQEQEQREIAERQKDDMIRQIAAATGQSAQMLRALNRRRFNTPPDSIAGSRNRDDDEVIADHIQQQEEERRLNDERLKAMTAELERKWFGDNNVPFQFAAN